MPYLLLLASIVFDWVIVIMVYIQFLAQKESALYLLLSILVGILLTFVNIFFYKKTRANKEK